MAKLGANCLRPVASSSVVVLAPCCPSQTAFAAARIEPGGTPLVPVEGRFLGDGAIRNASDGRFSRLIRPRVLWAKRGTSGRSGMPFVEQQALAMIPDRDVRPGAVGDIVAVSNVRDPEMPKVLRDCHEQIGKDAKEKLLEFVVRRFVDGGGGATRLLGRARLFLNKICIKHPATLGAFSRPENPDVPERDSFVRIVVHEGRSCPASATRPLLSRLSSLASSTR